MNKYRIEKRTFQFFIKLQIFSLLYELIVFSCYANAGIAQTRSGFGSLTARANFQQEIDNF